jgi:hypothetical protein
MSPQLKVASRLVEPDVTVSSDAKQLEIDSAKARNQAIEPRAFPIGVARVTGQKVHVIDGDVDVAKQMLLHEPAETSAVRGGEPDELVEVYRVDLRKIRAAGPMQADERVVDREGGLAGRQPDHRRRFVAELLDNERGRRHRRLVDAVADPERHGLM